jgi:hypothetical protein
MAALLLLVTPFVGYVLHYERVVRPRVLSMAGPIDLNLHTTDVAPDIILPDAPLTDNAASFYVSALNSYGRRRAPFLRKRLLDPRAEDPPVNRSEVRAIVDGSVRKSCDFYATAPDGSKPVFLVYPGGQPWTFVVATDPFGDRPYIPVMRAMAQAALNEGKARENHKNWFQAELLYHAVVRMAGHLRQNAGSFLDMQLGLELEQKGLHYLEYLYGLRGLKEKRFRCWRYGDSLARLQKAVRRKYAQLGNVEAARLIAATDKERVWRVVAVAALKTYKHFHEMGWLERRGIDLALGNLAEDKDPYVRDAARLVEQMPAKEFQDLPPEFAKMAGERDRQVE